MLAEPVPAVPGRRALGDAAFRAVVDALSIPVHICDTDGTLLYFGGSSEEQFGYSAAEVVGRNVLDFTPPEHAERALESLGDLAMSDEIGIGVPTVYPIICADGTLTWQAVAAVPMLDHPDVRGLVFYYLPWDAQLEFDNAVISLLEGADLSVVLGRLSLAIAIHFEAVAAAVHHGFDGDRFDGATITGLPDRCIVDDPRAPWSVAAQEDRPVYAAVEDLRSLLGAEAVAALDRAEIGGVWAIPVTMGDDDPAVLTVWRTSPMEPVTAHDFVTSRSLSYIRLVLTRWSERQALEYLAGNDSLTGLANRARFTAVVEEALDAGDPVVVLFCDVDGFKGVNDSHGHQAGDRILVEVARRLRGELAAADLLARIGGDEFTVMHVGDVASAEALAAGMIAAVGKPFDLDGQHIELGLSVGIATSAPGTGFSDLLNRADVALYRAKDGGGSGFAVS